MAGESVAVTEDGEEVDMNAIIRDEILKVKAEEFAKVKAAQKKALADQIERTFIYHAPKGDQAERYTRLRAKGKELAEVIAELTPASREQSIAITKVQEAIQMANAAIAINE